MKILDALEQKVAGLLAEIAYLKLRNAELEKWISNSGRTGQSTEDAVDRIALLEKALEKEKNLNSAILNRIDTLVQHLEEQERTV